MKLTAWGPWRCRRGGDHRSYSPHQQQARIYIHIIDSTNSRPELVLNGIDGRIGGRLTRIRSVPLVAANDSGGVRSVLEGVVVLVDLATSNVINLTTNLDEGINHSVEHLLILGLGRLNHETLMDREGHGRSMETIIHQTLGNIRFSDAVLYHHNLHRLHTFLKGFISRMNSWPHMPWAPLNMTL